jgi:hypothetical protein
MKIFTARILAIALLLAALAFAAPSSALAQEMTCPEHTLVTIDIKPGSSINKVNLASQGLLPVAALSTAGFDATLFTPEMAHLSDAASGEGCTGAMAVRWRLADVNNDGLLDLVFFFRVQDLGFTTSTTAATFMAHGVYDGMEMHIMGSDTVVVKP